MAGLPEKNGQPQTPAEQEEKERREAAMAEARKIALQILTLTRNSLFVSLRFMDVALCQFDYVSSEFADLPFSINTTATTGEHMIYDPRYIIQQYMRDRKALSRDYLHIVLHCVFRHPFVSTKLNMECWNLACDIAVENTICELELKQTDVQNVEEIRQELERIREFVTRMNAENLYRYLLSGQAAARDLERWKKLFKRDEHDIWWEVARQIEEEKKRKAEEEAEKNDEPDAGENTPGEEEQPDNEDENDETDESSEDGDAGDSGEEPEESEDEGTETGEETDEEPSADEDEDSGDSDADQDSSEEPNDEEDEPQEDYDEYEDEYTSSPGGESENDEGSAGDPNSRTQESENESSGDGTGGGNPGEDPEQTDEEGADRDSNTSTDGLTGQDDGHNPDQDKNADKGDLSGEAGDGTPDYSDDSFGDQSQQGNTQGAEGSGGIQKNQGSQNGEHSAGTGGGGDGSQSAWQHEGGATERSDGEIDTSDMHQLDGAVDPQADVHKLEGESPQEAKPQQGTKDIGADEEQDKTPSFMHNGEQQQELENKWKEISERMLVDLETSSKEWGDKSDSMVQSLKKINRDKYDYRTFLQKFSTIKEDIQLNDEEFDYVYYIYGLDHYGNMPLIEPLEYKEARKIHDFVIAIDTSGSCAGEVVQKFLNKTYSIFSQQENFFRKINLHIIQCDATIQSDVKITDKEEFKEYMRNVEFHGFGGTDFRPVFEYVNEMIDHHEFDDLRGLIYFTDGNGVYPKRRPDYETAFVFVDDDEFDYEVPSWAMKLVLETSDITEEVLI